MTKSTYSSLGLRISLPAAIEFEERWPKLDSKEASELRSIINETREGFRYVRVIETQKYRKMPHIHALVDCDNIRISDFGKEWFERWGYVKFSRYAGRRGAESYCAKYLVKENDADLEIGGVK